MRITEKKRVKIDHGCKPQPFFVSWRNTLGGVEHWLFYKRQTENLSTENLGTFEPSIDDLETAQGNIIDLSIFAQPSITVYANIETEDIQGLKSILYSPAIQVLSNPDSWETDGCKWITYRVETGSFKIRQTDETRHEVEITFYNPYINNIAQ